VTQQSVFLPQAIHQYILDNSLREPSVLTRLRAETATLTHGHYQIAPEEGQLLTLVLEGAAGSFDFALIDADKELYPTYYEQALTLIRPGGVIAIDNTLWRGTVVDPAVTKTKTETFRSFNAFIHADERVTQVMLPLGDGLTLARKRP